MKNPRILLLDVETAPMLTATFSLYPESIGHNNIIQDWFMLSWSWKELGSKVVRAQSVLDFKRKSLSDDYGLVKAMRAELEDVDVIIGHNIRRFDIKKLNARLIYHRLPPLPLIPMIDTLKEIRSVAQMSSNRLDYLGKLLLGHGKLKTSDGLWLRCMNADKKAMAEMVKYNKIDVIRLEEVYNEIRPYIKPSVNIGAMLGGDKQTCKHCGSDKFDSGSNKIRYSAAGTPKIQKKCAKCYTYGTYHVVKFKH